MSETKLPIRGTLTFSASADPGPSGAFWTSSRAGASAGGSRVPSLSL